MENIEQIMQGAEDIETRTERFHEWMKNSCDNVKIRYAINWRMPHTLFNISSSIFDSKNIQKIDWYKIFKSKDMGVWSHGGQVIC